MERAVAKPTIHFSGIGNTLAMHFSIEHLSGRDKVNLCQNLMELLGISKCLSDSDNTKEAQRIITEQWNEWWDK